MDRQQTARLVVRLAERCRQAGRPLTANREAVLRVLAAKGQALSAYDILAVLRDRQPGMQPPTVYRALAYLLSVGVIHQIASKKRYLLCNQLHHPHRAQLLICQRCEHIEELAMPAQLSDLLNESAAKLGFRVAPLGVELQGLCYRCQSSVSDNP